jgi:hypothetical protein
MKKIAMLVALLVLAGGLQAFADTIVYNDPAGQGTQNFGGNLALDFTVNSPVTVDALGVFNASGSGTITGTIDVALYDVTTSTVVATARFNGPYTPVSYDVFQPITPVVLAPGLYQVDAVGFSSSDLNGNLNTLSSSGPTLNPLGGALTFTGAGWDSNTSLDYPTTCSTCKDAPSPQDSQFDAGTFEASPVPEPSSLLLLGSGLAAFAGMLRRKLRA